MIRNKRRMLIVVIAVLAIIPLLIILNTIDYDTLIDKIFKEDNEIPEMNFHEPNYEINILDDPEYVGLNRTIYFKVGAETFSISEVNTGNPGQHLFIEYFDSIIMGNADKYNSLFTADYLKKNGEIERFTMQRVYSASVEAYPAEKIDDNITRHIYRVMYCIMKNDGTLRRDVGSDANLPLLIEVLEYRNGDVKINSISRTNYKVN